MLSKHGMPIGSRLGKSAELEPLEQYEPSIQLPPFHDWT